MPLYDGLDSAFFAPKAFTPPRLSADPYVALTFDRYPEPDIDVAEARNEQAQKAFRYGRHWWNLRTPGLQNALSHSGKAVAYLGHLLDRRTLPTTIDGLSVVRPEHRSNPHMTRKIYQHRNALVSDEPWTYLTLYANAELVLADRVHACVAALAYGRPAMLFNPSPRQALFARLGVEDIGLYPVEVDPGRLEEEQERQLAWLRGRFA